MTDIYRRAVSQVLGIKPEDVTTLQREKAKMACFSAMYGLRSEPVTDEEVFNDIVDCLSMFRGLLV